MNARLTASLGGAPEPENSNWVPLYGPDRTEIGKARYVDGHLEIDVEDLDFQKLLKHNLIGLSTTTLDRDRAEDILNEEKEKTDE